ncbi:hypothetical protein [Roseateles sp.]|uniref:hypothetical protein n=1 Tax=Roseateles sp. TaxID=1971397 RepID=UPI0025CC522D|nr:hypothetical protein [Roseateles sp.]MBV8034672.1 hypothetical protein [Roseateles sp.]
MKHLLLVLAVLGCTLPALAQTQSRSAQVFRCGPDGRDLRDSPCPDGSGASSVSFDQPSGADVQTARERHLADARQAAALAQARRASEAEARLPHGHAVGLQVLPPPAQAASAPQVVHLRPPHPTWPLSRPHKPHGAASGGR